MDSKKRRLSGTYYFEHHFYRSCTSSAQALGVAELQMVALEVGESERVEVAERQCVAVLETEGQALLVMDAVGQAERVGLREAVTLREVVVEMVRVPEVEPV